MRLIFVISSERLSEKGIGCRKLVEELVKWCEYLKASKQRHSWLAEALGREAYWYLLYVKFERNYTL